MMDLLGKGAAWLEQQRTKFAAQEVYYLRGDSSVVLRATVGRSIFDQTGSDGLVSRTETRDYLILAADLLIDDVADTAKPGDQIIEGGLEDGFIYEVMAMPDEPCWRWSDQYRLTYRIHTKYVGRQPQIP